MDQAKGWQLAAAREKAQDGAAHQIAAEDPRKLSWAKRLVRAGLYQGLITPDELTPLSPPAPGVRKRAS